MRALWTLVVVGCGPGEVDPPDDLPTDIPTVVDSAVDTATDTAPPVEPVEPITDVFTYAAPTVDLFFVVDASTSMIDEVDVLIGALDNIVATWDALGIDYHAGVVDMDESPTHGHLLTVDGYRWADPSHPEPGTLLRQLVGSVSDPSSVEAGRAAAYKALNLTDAGEPNEGFLRADSELAIIIFGDADDQSTNQPVSPSEFVDYLNGLRSEPEMVSLHAIAATTDYMSMSTAVGGIVWSIDNSPFGPVLDAITDSFERTNIFALSAPAVPESVLVRVIETDAVESTLAANILVYDAVANTVDLDAYLPSPGAVVEITYEPADPQG